MLYDYSKNNIFDGLDLHINSEKFHMFLVHNFGPELFAKFNSFSGKIVLLFYVGDYFCYNMLDEILCNNKNYYDQHGQLKNYYIILSVHDIDNSIKKEYKDYFTFIVNPLFYIYYSKIFKNNTVDLLANKKLYFLSFNGRADQHRQSLFYFFNKFSLLDKSYFSYFGDLSSASLSKFNSLDDITLAITNSGVPWYLTNLDFNDLNKQVPLVIPNHSYKPMVNTYDSGEAFLYEDTFCSIVTEAYYTENYPYFTEKTFRPISQAHPFILDSGPNSLKLLQDMGFKTFSNFWDESYDQLRDNQRLEAVMHLILEIGNWNIDKINAIHKKMIPILEHNKNYFFNVLPKIYKDYKPKLFEEIKHIVTLHQGTK
jgi:hypothetical protein